MSENINILQITGSESFGGVSSIIYNYFSCMGNSNIKFDFLSPRKSSFESKRSVIEKNNNSIYELGINTRGFKYYCNVYRKMRDFLKNKEYDIVHINSGLVLYNAILAKVAKKYSNSVVIVHSHSAYKRKGIKKIICNILKYVITSNADYYFACSKEAASSMFSKKVIKQKKYIIINNGIIVRDYLFNEEKRNLIRTELGIDNNCILLGNVARLTPVKNHDFMINLLETLLKKNDNYKLIFVGDGELKEKLKTIVSEKNLNDKVIFTGMKSNVPDYYSAMDVFLFPSFSEGLGMSAIEAQANGLECIASNTIPKDVKITDLLSFANLNDYDEWSKIIMNIVPNLNHRTDYNEIIDKSEYNVEKQSRYLANLYFSIMNKENKK